MKVVPIVAEPGQREYAVAAFVLAFVRYARWRAVAAAVLIALGALFEGVGLLLLVPLLGVLIGQGQMGHAGGTTLPPILADLPGASDRTSRLIVLLGLFAGLMLVRAVVLAIRDRTIGRLQLSFVEAIRTRLIDALARANWQTVAQVSHARIVQVLSVDMHQSGMVANAALMAAVAVVMLAGNCALALVLAPRAGVLALVFALAGMLVSRPFLRHAQRLGRATTIAYFGMTEGAIRFLGGLKLAKAQGIQADFVREYGTAATAAMHDRLGALLLQGDLRNITATLVAAIGAATLLAGTVLFHLPAPVMIAQLLILSRMGAPAMVLQQSAQNMLHGLPSYAAVRALEHRLGQGGVVADGGHGAHRSIRPAAITLRGVTFRHAETGGIEAASLTIPAGAFVGITGMSGAGKTTLLDLIAGILVPQAGAILVGGHPLSGATLAMHRAGLAYVGQEPFLFDDSVRRNLAWSRPDADDEQMWAAIEGVGAGPLLRRDGLGLEMPIGQHGMLVSAGERQRIALARAILRRPTLLILDEATNAIDLDGERAILARLPMLAPAATILMVSHRPQSLAVCDHLIACPDASLSVVRASAGHDGGRAPSCGEAGLR